MPVRTTVVFVDSSVLMRLIGIDGDAAARETAEQFEERIAAGQQFVIPVTAIVEVGNRIAQQSSNRRKLAERLKEVLRAAHDADPPWIIRAAHDADPPWIIRAVTMDQQFIQELLDGNSTGSDLVTLIGDGRLGTGDVALLVERDQFLRGTQYTSAQVWSLDQELTAYS
ncbi:hypothetical protein [Candidatus Poriferisodalis sp.]|uniref:hypothetical protein n=1 Tax=Candidatus Poriferisodalis sp. TaxID=3101277 RepID=UPI003B013888